MQSATGRWDIKQKKLKNLKNVGRNTAGCTPYILFWWHAWYHYVKQKQIKIEYTK